MAKEEQINIRMSNETLQQLEELKKITVRNTTDMVTYLIQQEYKKLTGAQDNGKEPCKE